MKSLSALALLAAGVGAEFRRFDGPINAASNYIHYSEGYVVTPGFVDISNLVFETADDGASGGKLFPGKKSGQWDDDGEGEGFEGDDMVGDDGGNRHLDGEVSGSTVSLSVCCWCR